MQHDQPRVTRDTDRDSRVTGVTFGVTESVTVHRESQLPVPTRPDPSLPLKKPAAFATLTCHRNTSTEHSAPQDQLELGTQPQTARAPLPLAGQRWPVIRTGERIELPRWYRRAIARRDGWACRICHAIDQGEQWEVDHIIPWSAGGSDDSTNLRLTCQACNQQRGNRADPFARSMPPVISQCEDEGYGAPCDTRVWCGPHRAWELVPAEYARRYEASKLIEMEAESGR